MITIMARAGWWLRRLAELTLAIALLLLPVVLVILMWFSIEPRPDGQVACQVPCKDRPVILAEPLVCRALVSQTDHKPSP